MTPQPPPDRLDCPFCGHPAAVKLADNQWWCASCGTLTNWIGGQARLDRPLIAERVLLLDAEIRAHGVPGQIARWETTRLPNCIPRPKGESHEMPPGGVSPSPDEPS